MLSNAYFLAKFRFDTAENEPAKNLQKFANFADPNPLTLTRRRCAAPRGGGPGRGARIRRAVRAVRRGGPGGEVLGERADDSYSTHPLSLSANDLTVMHGKVTHSRISPFLSFTKS